jgi:hypothetical protein
MNPGANPEPQPAATPGQPGEQATPSTPPSITSSMDELGERLEEKNAGDEAAPLDPEAAP